MAWAILVLPLLIVSVIAAVIGPKQWAKYQEERRRRAEELSDARLQAIIQQELRRRNRPPPVGSQREGLVTGIPNPTQPAISREHDSSQ